ncbi:DUF4405 domain-containing protein [Desulfurispira natronophila]|uniref:Flavinylation-associated cytochrome domain-containing protein n=1 Tax=Desulfurispira natronophila TaxID=682562 RepID=A0A7W7Y4L7_9BACT|nr:DUF4405 domain-containing protein [Desulfurispira natronophila]MBB5021922.1 hypothetical protein [Desulfurispira natronophila]
MSTKPSTPKRFYLRAFTSLFLTFMALITILTGLLLYVVPEGKVARWAGWSFWGIDKGGWEAVHTICAFAFIIATILHIIYNWKLLLFYLKDRTTRAFTLRRELVAAVGLTVFLCWGSIALFPPFGSIMQLGDNLKDAWYEETDIQAPYGHAEQSPLRVLANRQYMDIDGIMTVLREMGIPVASTEQSLEDLQPVSGFSPMQLYDILENDPRTARSSRDLEQDHDDTEHHDRDAWDEEHRESSAPSGLGRLSLEEVSEMYDIDLHRALQELEEKGIVASRTESIRLIAERAEVSPSQLYEILAGH